jgi:nucleotide-binding universal stress UspA family protein
MPYVLAAIDDSATALPVVRVALRIAGVLGDDVTTLHVVDDASRDTATNVAEVLGLPLHVREGDPATEIAAAAADPDVRMVVLGSRALPMGARPAGHVALSVIRSVGVPVVVVPPDMADRPIRRVLVPLDGTGEVTAVMRRMYGTIPPSKEPDVVAVHVFGAGDVPAFSDHPGHETDAWVEEFLARYGHLDGEVHLELRVGRPAESVREVGDDVGADLVALGWKQNLEPGHGEVVRALLAEAPWPLMLVPLEGATGVNAA